MKKTLFIFVFISISVNGFSHQDVMNKGEVALFDKAYNIMRSLRNGIQRVLILLHV